MIRLFARTILVYSTQRLAFIGHAHSIIPLLRRLCPHTTSTAVLKIGDWRHGTSHSYGHKMSQYLGSKTSWSIFECTLHAASHPTMCIHDINTVVVAHICSCSVQKVQRLRGIVRHACSTLLQQSSFCSCCALTHYCKTIDKTANNNIFRGFTWIPKGDASIDLLIWNIY